jgi:hypothetical protein
MCNIGNDICKSHITTLSIATFRITTISIMPYSITTLSIKSLNMILNIKTQD